MDASEKYYYCTRCGKFHEYGTNKTVSRKLCFFCGKEGKKKAKIIGDSEGHTQICLECFEKYLLND